MRKNTATKGMRGGVFAAVIAAIAGLCGAANAADLAGKVQFVMGEVWAVAGVSPQSLPDGGNCLDGGDGGEKRLLKPGDEIFQSDCIQSGGERASAQIMMIDNARIAVRPKSVFIVSEYRYGEKDDDDNSSILSVIKGGFRTLSGKIGEKNKGDYRVTTPNGTIGLRGTDHVVFYVPGLEGSVGGVPPGTFNKVYKGGTFMERNGQQLDIGPDTLVGHLPPEGEPTFVPALPEAAEGPEPVANRPDNEEEEEEETSQPASNDGEEEEEESEQPKTAKKQSAENDGGDTQTPVAQTAPTPIDGGNPAETAGEDRDTRTSQEAANTQETLDKQVDPAVIARAAENDDSIIPGVPDLLPWGDVTGDGRANLVVATPADFDDLPQNFDGGRNRRGYRITYNPANPAVAGIYDPGAQGRDFSGEDTSLFLPAEFVSRIVHISASGAIAPDAPARAFFEANLGFDDGRVVLHYYGLEVDISGGNWLAHADNVGALTEKETWFDVTGSTGGGEGAQRVEGQASLAFGDRSLVNGDGHQGLPAFSRFDLENEAGQKLQGRIGGVLRKGAEE